VLWMQSLSARIRALPRFRNFANENIIQAFLRLRPPIAEFTLRVLKKQSRLPVRIRPPLRRLRRVQLCRLGTVGLRRSEACALLLSVYFKFILFLHGLELFLRCSFWHPFARKLELLLRDAASVLGEDSGSRPPASLRKDRRWRGQDLLLGWYS